MTRFTGLVAATYTPMQDDGSLRLEMVPRMVDFLSARGVQALYVCGSTGEGMSLTLAERSQVAESFIEAGRGRLPVIVQVGHNSLASARELAAHARACGAAAISATAPSYYPIPTVELLVECMNEIASAAADLPFYYYHIPALTGVQLDMTEFLDVAGRRIPSLAGLKYTAPLVHEYQACVDLERGRFDVLWGLDEMLLSAWVVGARGAVGSTYNIASPLYLKLLRSLEAGDLEGARRAQSCAAGMIRAIGRHPFHPAMKEVLRLLGLDLGPCRRPLQGLESGAIDRLRRDLDSIGFFDWARPARDGAP